jgi:hypothetical protein
MRLSHGQVATTNIHIKEIEKVFLEPTEIRRNMELAFLDEEATANCKPELRVA